ncbi:MAG: M24 family metallopeptidase [Candidatus Aminicenantes bacterium]|nr:M24 family metallopeptidase [Candidatus Aminicenantes bacterium]
MRTQYDLKSHFKLAMVFIILLSTHLTAALIFPPEEYGRRRQELMSHISDGVAVFLGASSPSNDIPFSQNNTLMYFCGVEIPGAILAVDGQSKQSTLFFSIEERAAESEGIPLELVRRPEEITGIERVQSAEAFPNYLSRLNNQGRTIYTMFYPQELMRDNTREKHNALYQTRVLNLFDQRQTRELQFVHQLRAKFLRLQVKDVSSIVWDMRKYKSPLEIEIMRQAGRIGVKAHRAVIRSTEPGITEKELAALFEYVCAKEGAQDLAFNTIIMSGKNHAFGHYHQYDRTLEDGDFVILDAGPDFKYYNVDFSTSFPVNSTFTPRQKELYQKAFLVRQACLNTFRPGISLQKVGEKIKEHLLAHGLSPDDPQVRGEIRYGGYNHSVGLATHDVMATFSGPGEILKPGFVFACDIQVIHPEEEIGIRLEDTIAITETGYINLAEGLPRTVEEVQELMDQPGIIQILKKNEAY